MASDPLLPSINGQLSQVNKENGKVQLNQNDKSFHDGDFDKQLAMVNKNNEGVLILKL